MTTPTRAFISCTMPRMGAISTIVLALSALVAEQAGFEALYLSVED